MKRIATLSRFLMLTLSLSIFGTGCGREDNPGQRTNYSLSAAANGAQEVPAKNVTGTGTLTGSYDAAANAISYTINWTGLTGAPTLMHFHGPALAGVSASPSLTISGFPTTAAGTFTGTATLTDAQEADLLSGKWYWNVHTATNGGGEIRGQVVAQ
jgi:hypothetical protein